VRQLRQSRYPDIKGLTVEQFSGQLDYIEKYYQPVRIEEVIRAVQDDSCGTLPRNAVLLTFDDGYSDHYRTVFPELKRRGMQGCFFPMARAIQEQRVLDVNKIHFLLATAGSKVLVPILLDQLDNYRHEYDLESNAIYLQQYALPGRYDDADTAFLKRMLQKVLPEKLRGRLLSDLFDRFVTSDEADFAADLYLSVEELQEMAQNGMYIGSHGYDHYWLEKLTTEQQEQEIELSLQFLRRVNDAGKDWVFCYPNGSYNDALISILEQKECSLAFTTKAGLATVSRENAWTLERLDTNDLPQQAATPPVSWTQQVLEDR
jgi:peptidoglycan/xylan/chitin deacetylase (PgdA/CDA1 family)